MRIFTLLTRKPAPQLKNLEFKIRTGVRWAAGPLCAPCFNSAYILFFIPNLHPVRFYTCEAAGLDTRAMQVGRARCIFPPTFQAARKVVYIYARQVLRGASGIAADGGREVDHRPRVRFCDLRINRPPNPIVER